MKIEEIEATGGEKIWKGTKSATKPTAFECMIKSTPLNVVRRSWYRCRFSGLGRRLMLRAFWIVAFIALFNCAAATSAGAITFQVNGHFTNGGQTFGGTFETDGSSIVGGDFTIASVPGHFTSLLNQGPAGFNGTAFVYFFGLSNPTNGFELYVYTVSLIALDLAHTGGSLYTAYYFNPNSNGQFLGSNGVGDVAPVPLPASLVLFASVLGIAGLTRFVRRRRDVVHAAAA